MPVTALQAGNFDLFGLFVPLIGLFGNVIIIKKKDLFGLGFGLVEVDHRLYKPPTLVRKVVNLSTFEGTRCEGSLRFDINK